MGLRDLINKMIPPGTQLPQQAQPQPPLGSGMAQQAAQILQSQPYRLHMQEAQAMGQQPMDPMQFMQMMQQKALPPAR